MSAGRTATMPDYSHLIGKRVQIPMRDPGARIPGVLESCAEIGPGVIFARIKREGGGTAFVGGHFELEASS